MKQEPSSWLLNNSSGYPDFLFTALTYSLVLLAFVTFFWVAFGALCLKYAGTNAAETLLVAMDSLKNGLVALAGVVFGLAGTYTARRIKRDQHTVELKDRDNSIKFVDDTNDI